MKKKILKNLFSIFVLIIILYTLYSIFKLGIIPGKYLCLVIIGEIVLFLICFLLYNLKQKFFMILGIFLYLISIIGNGFGYYYVHRTEEYFEKNFAIDTYKVTTPYYLITSSSNPVNDISELSSDTTIYYYPISTAANSAMNVLGEYLYSAVDNEFYSLLNVRNGCSYYITPKSEYIFLLGASNAIDESMYKIIKEFDVTEEYVVNDSVPTSFNVYITGLDYSGMHRDYNSIATVNLKTHKIVLTSIPRDYYVYIPAYDAKDSLSYLGCVDSKIPKEGLELLFNTKIDYTLNVYTDTLVKVVDTIGGIEFCTDKSFTTFHDITLGSYADRGQRVYVQEGCHTYDGLQTLAIARERKNIGTGERGRQENCRKIVTSILHKLASSSTIANYDEVLDSFDGLYTSNISRNTITAIVKEALRNPSFEIIEQSVDGLDGNARNHWDTGEIWTLDPYMDTVDAASQKINEVLKEK